MGHFAENLNLRKRVLPPPQLQWGVTCYLLTFCFVFYTFYVLAFEMQVRVQANDEIHKVCKSMARCGWIILFLVSSVRINCGTCCFAWLKWSKWFAKCMYINTTFSSHVILNSKHVWIILLFILIVLYVYTFWRLKRENVDWIAKT